MGRKESHIGFKAHNANPLKANQTHPIKIQGREKVAAVGSVSKATLDLFLRVTLNSKKTQQAKIYRLSMRRESVRINFPFRSV